MNSWFWAAQFGRLMRTNSYANTYTIYIFIERGVPIYRTLLTRIKSNPLASWFFAYQKYTNTYTYVNYKQPKRKEKSAKIVFTYFVIILFF